jgi:carboxyl-terminal processing protease
MKFYVLVPLFLLTFVSNGRVMQSTLSPAEQQLVELSQTLNEVFSLMYGPNAHYYKKLTAKEIKEGMEEAFQALAHRDPHSSFLGSDECKSLTEKMSGQFFGIGILLPGDKDQEEEFVPVIELVPNGPAEKAGLKGGDKIIQIDEAVIKGMKIDEVMTHLKGEKHTKVAIKAMRANHAEPLEFTVTRDVIKDEISASFYIEQHEIYYLLLSVFSEKSIKHIQALLEDAHKKECKGIIIDLRNNTGGLFEAALDIAGLFLPKGSVVATTKNRDNKVIESWKTTRKPLPRKE